MQCSTSFFTPLPTITPLHNHNPNHIHNYQHFRTIKSFNLRYNIDDVLLHTESTSSTPPKIPKLITSTSNPFVKHCVKLRQSSSYRRSHAFLLLVGSTLIRELHEFHVSKRDHETAIECLILLEHAEVPEGLGEIPVDRVYVSSLVMRKLAGVQSTESIEAIALMRSPSSFVELNDNQSKIDCTRWFGCSSTHRILVLDGSRKPRHIT
ncbi:hypothetical protein RND81_06G009700 [Saponaria officinalis]|uniref:Uncharacterized protein n=1 Tax=Saponaria officinalis TaxID=3572 RepID=A0AAW1K5I7_SAPOF